MNHEGAKTRRLYMKNFGVPQQYTNHLVIPAKAGTQPPEWIPAFAGMTKEVRLLLRGFFARSGRLLAEIRRTHI
jgi:hypothetical protein